jgi:hypothetical protein
MSASDARHGDASVPVWSTYSNSDVTVKLRGAEDPGDRIVSTAGTSPQIPELVFPRFPSPTKNESRDTSRVGAPGRSRGTGPVRFDFDARGRGRRRRCRNPHRGGSGIPAGRLVRTSHVFD